MDLSDYIAKLHAFIRHGQRPEESDDAKQYLDVLAGYIPKVTGGRERATVLELKIRLEASTCAAAGPSNDTAPSRRKRKRGGG